MLRIVWDKFLYEGASVKNLFVHVAFLLLFSVKLKIAISAHNLKLLKKIWFSVQICREIVTYTIYKKISIWQVLRLLQTKFTIQFVALGVVNPYWLLSMDAANMNKDNLFLCYFTLWKLDKRASYSNRLFCDGISNVQLMWIISTSPLPDEYFYAPKD